MKRKILAFFMIAALFSLVACVSSSEEDSETDKRCVENPKLPICQDAPERDDFDDDDDSSLNDEF